MRSERIQRRLAEKHASKNVRAVTEQAYNLGIRAGMVRQMQKTFMGAMALSYGEGYEVKTETTMEGPGVDNGGQDHCSVPGAGSVVGSSDGEAGLPGPLDTRAEQSCPLA